MTSDAVLLLTMTVNVNSGLGLTVLDPAVRLQQYSEALELWFASGAFSRIVICENSGYDGRTLRDSAACQAFLGNGGEFEYLSFLPGNRDEIQARGKGLGEMGILRHALTNSHLIAKATHVAKMTGRLYLRNIRKLLDAVGNDLPDLLVNFSMRLNNCDSRFFLATKDCLVKYLFAREDELDDRSGMYMEKVLMRAVLSAMSEGERVRIPATAPWFQGTSGSMGVMYGFPYMEQLNLEIKRRVLKW